MMRLSSAAIDPSLLDELCEQLLARLAGRVQRVVLYGSHARGGADAESDVDVLVVVEEDGQAALDEARRARYEVMRNHGFKPLISLLLLSVGEWQDLSRHSAGLKRNIEREGLTIWPRS